MKQKMHQLKGELFLVLLWSVVLSVPAYGAHPKSVERIHMQIISAPVVANGVVAYAPTEINILLHRAGVRKDLAMDPGVFGLQIPAGGHMEVELGGSFIPNPDFAEPNPELPLFKPARNIILTTGPQNPVAPNTHPIIGGFWGVRFDPASPEKVTVFPRCGDAVPCQNIDEDLDPERRGGLNGERARAIGFKVIHIRPNDRGQSHQSTPFYNGRPGSVGVVYVRIFDAQEALIAAGVDSIVFRPRVGPQVHLSNASTRDDNSVVSLTDFQHVLAGIIMDGTSIPEEQPFDAGRPYAPQFTLFTSSGVHDRDKFPSGDILPGPGDDVFIPFFGIDGVTVEPFQNKPHRARLVQHGVRTIGHVIIHGPARNSGAEILANNMETEASDGDNGSRLFVPIKVGELRGRYELIVRLNGGGMAVNTIIVD